jgi:hypothetical protein
MSRLPPLSAIPFEAENDLCRLLATLQERPLCDMLEYAALTSRATWTAAALKVGVLDVSSFIEDVAQRQHGFSSHNYRRMWRRRCSAMLAMARSYSSLKGEDDACYRLTPSVLPEMDAVLPSLMQSIVDAYCALAEGAPHAVHPDLEDGVAEAMCLCAMLGRGDLLQVLLEGCPQAAARMLASPLYEDFFAAQFDVTATGITPLMVALIFKQQRCAQLLQTVLDPQGMLFEYESKGGAARITNENGVEGLGRVNIPS